MLAWTATATTFVCAVMLLYWGFALVVSRSIPALYEITRTLTFRSIFGICLLIMLVTLGMVNGGPVEGSVGR